MPRRLVRRTQEPEPEVDAEEEPKPEWKPTPLLYNVADACFILGKISKQMIYRLIHLGRLLPVHIGTRSLFTMGELERYVATLVEEAESQKKQAG
jgi:hypothetical protein